MDDRAKLLKAWEAMDEQAREEILALAQGYAQRWPASFEQTPPLRLVVVNDR
jgi:hypothetical protein